MNNPLAGAYLRWAYKKGIEDLLQFNLRPAFKREGFTCLLCGVANERTADEFITFVLKKNSRAHFWIIDIGKEQIDAVKKLVGKKYGGLDIRIEQVNALELSGLIKQSSIDWIETDAFMEFFDVAGLEKLFHVWHFLLKPNGFITTRDYISNGPFARINDFLRIWQMRIWLGVNTFAHSSKDFSSLFKKCKLQVVEGPTFIPTFKRFAMVKSEMNSGNAHAQV